ncbi:MAG: N-acylneuraminate cytidylyltransferase [Candidatus Taylorbacteria bacterium CG11_big_fil_rev_8_21_14_0_20_46_11]|uniref:N-acylneuraminate cytidylyltransferase n=1 Tax=Candidatus Taylorbacteria bacterium CG11_big_fil_rev_8_21_14_0_20_46_11 TaxID=1975025 RepID=A0A2H0KCR4_9BACT|nr:MAG: N-acylneuraminate cytidylyltransferase [Candidatus Taylorbacteria bacterium CG11_big_fil_rev_8_21_14_0_20_46_11]
MKILAIIPARGGSKRIPNKNIKDFCGKPLIAYTVEQAKQCSFIDRVIVDTDSEDIATLAKNYGAEVPFLRPVELAGDDAQVVDSVVRVLDRLLQEEKYEPTHVLILQTTSPLRESEDIEACMSLMQETDATTVLTVAPTHPRLYHLDGEQNLVLGNKYTNESTNMQAWRPAFLLNGCFVYMVEASALRKEKKIITERTKAVICDKWRSVDLDTMEEWVLAEFLYAHKKELEDNLKKT